MMFSFLKNHPFAVEAHFKSSIVLTFAVPKEQLEPLVPACLSLDTFDDKWAFIAVAMVQTNKLRPKGFPEFLGRDFLLIGYRIFVRYTTNAGKRLRGLYILRSETNKKSMEWLSSLFTRYKYHTTDIQFTTDDSTTKFRSASSGFVADVYTADMNAELPEGSPFSNWKEARRFAGPLPFTFSYDATSKQVLIVEGVREDWTPQPIRVADFNIPFLQELDLQDVRLASAFEVRDIPYYWKKGRTEIWQG